MVPLWEKTIWGLQQVEVWLAQLLNPVFGVGGTRWTKLVDQQWDQLKYQAFCNDLANVKMSHVADKPCIS